MNAFETHLAGSCKEYLDIAHRLRRGGVQVQERLENLAFRLRLSGVEADPEGQDLSPVLQFLEVHGLVDNTVEYLQEMGHLNEAAKSAWQQSQFARTADICDQICALQTRQFGEMSPRLDPHLMFRAKAYHYAGNFEHAETLYLEVIDRSATYRGPDCHLLSDCRRELAEVFAGRASIRIKTGRFLDAELSFHKALELAAQNDGERSLPFAKLASDLAELYSRMGRFRQAQEWARRTEVILLSMFPDTEEPVANTVDLTEEDRESYFISWNQVAVVSGRLKESQRAENILKALKAAREANDTKAKGTLGVINDLVGLYLSLGRSAEAELLMQEFLSRRQGTLAEESLEYARPFENQAGLCGNRGEFQKALDYALKALEIKRRHWGHHPELVVSLSNLAEIYRRLNRIDEAKAGYQEGLGILEEFFPEGHPNQVAYLNDLGDLRRNMGDLQAAEDCQRQALALQRRFFPEGNGKTADILRSLGDISLARARYSEAKDDYRQAIEIRRASGEAKTRAGAEDLARLAHHHHLVGDFKRARERLDEAYQIRTELYDLDTHAHWDDLLARANLRILMGDYPQARNDLERLLDIRQNSLGKEHPSIGRMLFYLAVIDFYEAQFSAARSKVEKAIRILGQGNFGNREMCHAMLFRADILRLTGDLETAIDDCRWVCERLTHDLGAEHPDGANARLSLSDALQQAGDYEEAEGHLRKALVAFRHLFADSHPAVALTLVRLANLQRVWREFTVDENALTSALQNIREMFGQNHAQYAFGLHELAQLLLDTDRLEEAELNFKQARGILDQHYPKYHFRLGASCCHGLARIQARRQNYVEAHALLLKSLQSEDVVMDEVMGYGSETQRLNFLQGTSEKLNDLLTVTGEGLRQDRSALRSTFEALLGRKMISVEIFAKQREIILTGHDDGSREKLQGLGRARQAFSAFQLAGGPRLYTAAECAEEVYRSGVNTWNILSYEFDRQAKEQLERALSERTTELRQLGRRRRDSVAKVVDAIPEHAALIEFVNFHRRNFLAKTSVPHYAAFVATRGNPDPLWIELGPAEIIEREMNHLLRSMPAADREVRKSHKPSLKQRSPGKKLHQLLIAPLEPDLHGVQHLFLAPDGLLLRLPFEVLPVGGGKNLIDVFDIVYLGCGRDLLDFSRPLSEPPQAPVVIADPSYSLTESAFNDLCPDPPLDEEGKPRHRPVSARGLYELFGDSPQTLKPLKEARKEGEVVSQLLGVPCLEGEQVLEDTVKKVQSPHILHLATHGFFLSKKDLSKGPDTETPRRDFLQNPLLRSGLAMAGFNNAMLDEELPPKVEDGVLTADDVTRLNLTGTEVVVLSACSTGLGDGWAGEGLFGLRRAFSIAGARTLILSLCPVGDEATRLLMEEFYGHLLSGKSRIESLRLARLALRSHPQFSSPWSWGSFILVGDPGPLMRNPPIEA